MYRISAFDNFDFFFFFEKFMVFQIVIESISWILEIFDFDAFLKRQFTGFNCKRSETKTIISLNRLASILIACPIVYIGQCDSIKY